MCKYMDKRKFKKTKTIYIKMMSLFGLADKLFGSIYIAFMRSKNLSMIGISRLFSIQQILVAVFDFPTGAISDKMGRKRIAAYGFITWGLSVLIFAFSTNFSVFLISMIFMALGSALISGSPSAWLIDHMIRDGVYDKRTQILPKIQAIVSLFSIMASLLAYMFIDISNSLPIIIAGILSICTGIYALIFGEENYGGKTEKNFLKSTFNNSVDFIKDKKLIILAVKSVTAYISFVSFVLYWQIYVTETLNIDMRYLPIFLVLFMILLMMGNYAAALVMKRTNSFMSSILGLIISFIGFVAIFSNKSLLFFTIGCILIEFGLGLEQSSTSTWTCDYIMSETRATYGSIISTIQAISGFIIINLLGVISENRGINSIWIISSIAIVVEIIIVIVFSKKYINDKVVDL